MFVATTVVIVFCTVEPKAYAAARALYEESLGNLTGLIKVSGYM
jgi:hypothetical protein